MQWRNLPERPPGASCSCTSCCPTECLRHGADEHQGGISIGEGSHNAGTPADLAIEAFNDVVRADPCPVPGGEIAEEVKYTYDNLSQVTGCTVENGINTGRVAGNHTIIGDYGTDSTSRNDIFVLTFIWGMPRVPPLSFLLLTIEYTPKIVWLGMRTQDSVRAGRGCGKSSAPILPENVPLHSEDWFLSEPSAAVLQQRYVLPAEFHHMQIRPTPYLRQSRNWCMPLRLRQGSDVHANTFPAKLLSCDYCCHLH